MKRYFVNEIKNNQAMLSEEDSYHFKTVLRGKVGEKIEIIKSKKCFHATVTDISFNVICTILKEQQEQENQIHITIAQAIVKEQKMDFILQKSCELGMEQCIPWISERSVVKVSEKEEKKTERWKKIVKNAAEQSKSSFIPAVTKPYKIKDLLSLDYDMKLLCTVNEKSKTLKKVLSNKKKNDRIIIVIGPEGGFSPNEESQFIQSGFQPISLGNQVLRTETAPLFILSCIKYEFME